MTRVSNGLLAILASGLLGSFAGQAWAGGTSDFQQGVQAFHRGNYGKAAHWFETAYRSGPHSIQLLYNLGVSYYKLGRYDKARRYFQLLTDHPSMASLARYNLAVIADRQGRPDDAIRLLEQVIDQSTDKKLEYVARAKLRELRAKKGGLQGFVLVRSGYNDNVSVAPTGTAAGPDSFTTVFAHLQDLVKGSWNDGWYVSGDLLVRSYSALTVYDQDALQTEVRRQTNWGSIPGSYGAFAATSTFGGSPYQNVFGLETSARWVLDSHTALRAHYQFEDIRSRNATYNYLQGSSQQVWLERDSSTRIDRLRLRYELELNNRLDQPTASFSPTRNIVSVRYQRGIWGRWQAHASLSYGISDYPVVGTQNRHDRCTGVALGLSRKFGSDVRMRIRYLYTNNQSTDSVYRFQSNQVDAGLTVYF